MTPFLNLAWSFALKGASKVTKQLLVLSTLGCSILALSSTIDSGAEGPGRVF